MLEKPSARSPLPALVVALLAGLAAGPSHAGRSLQEPPAVKAVPRMVPKAKQQASLEAASLASACPADVLKSQDLQGVTCRLGIHGQLALQAPLEGPAQVDKLLVAASEAMKTAGSIADYQPLAKTPRLEPSRLAAHEQACKTVVSAYDALKEAARNPGPVGEAAKKGMGSAEAGLFKDACDCAQQTVRIADGAGVSLEDRARLQTVLTSRSCFLDKTKVAANRGGPDSQFSGRAGRLAEANTDEALLLDYAKTVDIGLDRCRTKGISPGGQVSDKGGLKKCACGEIQRWRFPKQKGRPDVEIVVPILDTRVGVRITVTAPGKVTSCGPLEGSAL